MLVSHEINVKLVELKSDTFKNVKGKVLISPACGSDVNVLRLFEVGQDGFSANHKHDYPHYIYVLEGEGTMEMDGKKTPVVAGSFAFVPNNIQHQLVNTTKTGRLLRFLCMVPVEGHVGFGD
ncbi:MAG: cupin domain-containing protein [Sedimentibacter sp.]|uniref:cupin domain-containing protein n=1 Tax=Sedimentibacter sp. TaxID=1960295 RepID=UPI002982AD67|nr:cupin domain-containing protein [Sedimentibacter sp.]MDW5300614.1 cupin domain-containing protein [Sedimentibacter sp.]